MARYVVRLAKNAGIVILFLIAAFLGTVSGVLFAFAGDLPQISALDDYAPSTISRVYGSHGEVIGDLPIPPRPTTPHHATSPNPRQPTPAPHHSDSPHHSRPTPPPLTHTPPTHTTHPPPQ